MVKVAINGFGRIGRAFLRLAIENRDIEIVAINDLADLENLAYLLRHDSAYGSFSHNVEVRGDKMVVGGKEIKFLSEREPANLPWSDLNIDVVVESTGFFADYEKANAHIEAGAKKVVISSPVKDAPDGGVPGATVLMGVNSDRLATCDVSANASCTTNAASPVVSIMEEALDIKKAILNTIHAVTATQGLVDGPSAKDFRKNRSGIVNIIPTTTGAAEATTKAVKGIEFFDGISVRVPVLVGSLVDITFISGRDTSVEEVNDIFRKASKEERWRGIFTVSEEPLVSSDIVGNTHASIIDLQMTKVVGGNLVKVLVWYDNEMGYTNTLVRHVLETAKNI
ncbi:type I glyceraldehyde-3-phosphate dehydrogenase [Candidatus Campbellbacteria bacterium CG22_combo_CG10-13_8_21_14_all_36_13]|uniref:Type I glyceraldehyde-3-phosphate dehydrogenase n=1 Tax=Candidatus Campbellbacteria bacterium CG22_combo_CG10-13_8_21_14_all_36_13 TaxID=1974529 RepID=A0A2H0DYM1_9BACT|nr:MAG: type I glyceraldehyde-3-phosphate dehydrogenase [Candidatus Campbellbacteria bacterium CG22_combo_CG10-13_8_21_14_all_36_13]